MDLPHSPRSPRHVLGILLNFTLRKTCININCRSVRAALSIKLYHRVYTVRSQASCSWTATGTGARYTYECGSCIVSCTGCSGEVCLVEWAAFMHCNVRDRCTAAAQMRTLFLESILESCEKYDTENTEGRRALLFIFSYFFCFPLCTPGGYAQSLYLYRDLRLTSVRHQLVKFPCVDRR